MVGDSHAADITSAIRSAGFDVGNIGGPYCALAPAPGKEACSAILEKAHGLARSGKVQGVAPAKWWGPGDVAPESLKRVVDYWSDARVPVLLFTPMPIFARIMEQIPLHTGPGRSLDEITDDTELLAETEPAIEALTGPGLTLINTRARFCGAREGPCPAFDGLEPLLIDTGHLSPHGAEVMGRRIVASDTWQRWVASLPRAPR